MIGKSEKTYFLDQRIWRGIQFLAKTILTLGIGLFFEEVRADRGNTTA